MSLQDLGSLGEFIGAVAVIVSLIYVGVQVRQNTQSVRSSAFQAAIRDATDNIDQVVHDPELNRIWLVGLRDLDSLSHEERYRFAGYMTSILRRYESLLYQTQQGTLDPGAWEGIRANLKNTFSHPGILAWWPRARHLFNRQLQEFVEGELLGGEQGPEAGNADDGEATEADRP